MSKFHINSKGEPGICKATSGGCPFGSVEEHYSSKEEAILAYEKIQEANLVSTLKRIADSEVAPTELDLDSSKSSNNIPTLPKDTFITIPNPDDPYDMPITEGFPTDMGRMLIAGQYEGYYYDEESDSDKPALVTVNSDGSVLAQPLHDDNPWVTPEPSYDVTESYLSTRDKITKLKDDVDGISKYVKGQISTILKARAELDPISQKMEYSKSLAEFSKNMNELNDLQEEWRLRAHRADASGDTKEAQVWFTASDMLSDALGEYLR